LAATLEVKGDIEVERIAEAFDRLDSDDSGFISPQNLRDILGNYSDQEIQSLVAEADTDKDGQISFEEFKRFFRKSTRTLSHKVLNFNE
jgi:calcium-dependent protein kinase